VQVHEVVVRLELLAEFVFDVEFVTGYLNARRVVAQCAVQAAVVVGRADAVHFSVGHFVQLHVDDVRDDKTVLVVQRVHIGATVEKVLDNVSVVEDVEESVSHLVDAKLGAVEQEEPIVDGHEKLNGVDATVATQIVALDVNRDLVVSSLIDETPDQLSAIYNNILHAG